MDRDGLLAEGHVQRHNRHYPMREDTCFRIGSITKTFTSLAIMQLVERGQVDIDADIQTYLPGFSPINPFAGRDSGPFGPQVTLRKLMSHTAGIVREPKSGHYLDAPRPTLAALSLIPTSRCIRDSCSNAIALSVNTWLTIMLRPAP